MKKKKEKNNFGLGFFSDFAIGTIVFCVIAFVVFQTTFYAFDSGKKMSDEYANKDENEVVAEITIQDGTTLDQLSNLLKENNIISNELYFKLESRLFGWPSVYEAGTFEVKSTMNNNQIMSAINNPATQNNDITITIKEGYTISDIGDYLESKSIVAKEDFLTACAKTDYNYDFLDPIKGKENYLEGYLFPDTYRIYEDATSEDIINKMLSRFDEIYDDEMRQATIESGRTMQEVVTIASIIEKEIKVPEERVWASSVIENRLDQNMKLQMCSTVLYVLDKNKKHLLLSDLEVKSPYNTYLNAGLPAGPISNPGAECLRAAVYPADTDYIYFVVNDEELGTHVFTNSYDKFIDAKEKYNQKF